MRIAVGNTGESTWALLEAVDDPHLPEVVCQILRLSEIEEGRDPGPCRKIPVDFGKGRGVGMRYVVVPLRAFVWTRTEPGQAALVVAGVVGGLFGLGYLLGRRKR